MVRLRRLSSEFNSPDQIVPGAILTMPYLADMRAYQEYLDGHLEPLWARNTNEPTDAEKMQGRIMSASDDANGFGLYRRTGVNGIWQLNLFHAVSRYTTAVVFEHTPAPIDADAEIAKQWDDVRRPMMREMRKAVDWFTAKGRGVLVLEEQMGSLVFRAVDPAGWMPIKHPRHRDQVIGQMMLEWWRAEPRVPDTDIATRVDVTIHVTEDDVAHSDGYIPAPVQEVRTFWWQGYSQGALGTLEEVRPSRVLGMWTFGDDWSVYGSMERLVFEALMAASNARTCMTRDVRSDRIIPSVIDEANLDPEGQFYVDLLQPDIRVPVDEMRSGSGFGYVEPPGPAMSEAWAMRYEQALANLAEAADMPRIAFGEGYESREPDAAVRRLTQSFITKITDIRDDLGPIMAEVWELQGGPPGVKIGWGQEPFVDQTQIDDRAIKLHNAGIIGTSTAQAMVGVPIEEVSQPFKEKMGDAGNDTDSNVPGPAEPGRKDSGGHSTGGG